ncbi:MAG: dodecin family protein [Bacillota bacterium]
MTVVKVVELMGESATSWEDAVNQAVKAASQTVRNISGVEVMNMTASVDNGKITKYKADVHVAFAVDGT